MQAHGDGLGPGWQLVLDMLEDVATKEESNARIIRVGHECVDLIITDFLPSLPPPQLRRTLHVEACFVLQEVDLNTCYAASLLLWRAADTIGCALQLMRAAAGAPPVRTTLTTANTTDRGVSLRAQHSCRACRAVTHRPRRGACSSARQASSPRSLESLWRSTTRAHHCIPTLPVMMTTRKSLPLMTTRPKRSTVRVGQCLQSW